MELLLALLCLIGNTVVLAASIILLSINERKYKNVKKELNDLFKDD